MKKLGKISAFALIQVAAMSAAGAASAAGSFSFPSGQVIYNFNTPSVSIYGAIQYSNYSQACLKQPAKSITEKVAA